MSAVSSLWKRMGGEEKKIWWHIYSKINASHIVWAELYCQILRETYHDLYSQHMWWIRSPIPFLNDISHIKQLSVISASAGFCSSWRSTLPRPSLTIRLALYARVIASASFRFITYAFVQHTNIGSDNGLSPVRCKPLSEPILPYCQLDPTKQTSVKLKPKFIYFCSWKCIWKCRLRNFGQFVSASMCQWLPRAAYGPC